MNMLGWQEMLLIALFVLLFFGAKRIPEIARSLGKASHEFKKAKDELSKETEDLMNAAEKNADAQASSKKETKDATDPKDNQNA
ncbi:MAG: twin-arginine translocase TatA/TatE family subunit [Lentisphaerae bacterium]|nr:twin-arginine translocase TatA/TatE family subunit [Lentisphaerota bacterium]MCP4101938.1 twin-arginine translocase TatA/TatE family subunit [Lentisphaerota bacterium]